MFNLYIEKKNAYPFILKYNDIKSAKEALKGYMHGNEVTYAEITDSYMHIKYWEAK